MGKPIQWTGNLGSAQSGDQWSRGIWDDCPWGDIKDGLVKGIAYEFDFATMPITPPTTEGNFGDFTAFSSTGGTMAPVTDGHGWAFGSDGDNEGASFRTRVTPFKIIRTGYKFWWEAQVKSSTIADTKHGIFCGMMEDAALTATVPIAADGTLADQNLFGFHRLEGDGDYFDTVYKANGVTAVTVQADAAVMVADTYQNLGMKYEPREDPFLADPNGSGTLKYNLFFYNNGLRLSSYKQIPSAAGTDFPNDVYMGFVFAVLNATGSTPGTSAIRRLRIAQAFEPTN